MGQAKLRGSFEQRQAEAIAKREADAKRRAEERAIREANMTPAERARAHRVKGLLAAIAGFMAAGDARKADFSNAMQHYRK